MDLRDKNIDELLKQLKYEDKPIEYPAEDHFVMLNPNVYANLIYRAFETEREKKAILQEFVDWLKKSFDERAKDRNRLSKAADTLQGELYYAGRRDELDTINIFLGIDLEDFIKEKKL